MKIILDNIQSIKHYEFEFADHGLVEFTGHNNNGKSILVKAIRSVCRLEIYSNLCRANLINDNAKFGQIIFEKDDKSLAIVLTRERNDCTFAYIKTINGEKTVQQSTIRENMLPEYLKDFGFSVFGKNEVCLQVYDFDSPIPFVNAHKSLDSEIIDSVCKDEAAINFLESYANTTYSLLKSERDIANRTAKQLEGSLATLHKVENIEKRKELIDRINAVEKYAGLFEFNLEYINPIPSLTIIDEFKNLEILPLPCRIIPEFKLDYIHLPKEIIPEFKLNNLDKELDDYLSAMNSVCPTCGRKLIGD